MSAAIENDEHSPTVVLLDTSRLFSARIGGAKNLPQFQKKIKGHGQLEDIVRQVQPLVRATINLSEMSLPGS